MSKETAFSIFCLESYKVYKSLTGKQTAELFHRYGVFDYLNEFMMFFTRRDISTSIRILIST